MAIDTLPDYYAILRISPQASLPEIKKAYHRLMLELGAHPDRGGDHEQAARINEAWALLRDPTLRHAYDELRQPADTGPETVDSRIDRRPERLDDAQWDQLQQFGELRFFAYQEPGDRACTCNRCGHPWLTRRFHGMPARCPACRRTDWAWLRYAYCFVCHHGFPVADLERPIADVRAQCPSCRADDWSLRPVVLRCRACDTPNRVRRSCLEKAYCGRCHYGLGERQNLDTTLRRLWQRCRRQGNAWLDRWLIQPFGAL